MLSQYLKTEGINFALTDRLNARSLKSNIKATDATEK